MDVFVQWTQVASSNKYFVHLETKQNRCRMILAFMRCVQISQKTARCRSQSNFENRLFSLTSRDVTTFFPAYFSVIFSMFCIEQAKIYREAKFGSDRVFGGWTIGKQKCQILACLTRGAPCWCTTLVHQHGGQKWSRILLKIVKFKLKTA